MHNDNCITNNKASWLKQCWPWLVCCLAAFFYSYEYILRIAPGTMIPQLRAAFSTEGLVLDSTQIGHLSAFYYYAYMPMQFVVGIMMDKHGPRWILTMAIFCCAFGTFAFAYTHTIMVAQIGRFLMGFGSAFAFVGVLKLAANWLPPERFAFMAGLTTALGMLCAMFGTTWLTVFNNSIGWESTMMNLAKVGFVLMPIVWLVVRDAPDNQQVVTATVSPSYIRLFKEIFISFRNPQIWLTGLIGLFMIAPTVIFAEFWGIEYLKGVHGLSKVDSSKIVSMVFLGWAVGGPVMGFFSDHIRRRKLPVMIGCIGMTAVMTYFLYAPFLSKFQMQWLLFLMGFFSSAEIIVFAIGRENCRASLAATVVAVINLVVVGAAFMQIAAGYILDRFWSGGFAEDGGLLFSRYEFTLAMSLMPLCSVAAFCLCFILRETYCRPYDQTD